MEEASKGNNGKKRARGDSDLDSPEVLRVDSEEAKRFRKDSDFNSFELYRVDSDEWGINSPESNGIPNDILDILDEPDTVADCGPAIRDLDSVIKSFEEEILHPSPAPPQTAGFPVNPTEHGESRTDLGYLLEASDDELGLPPTVSPSDEQPKTKTESVDLAIPSEILGFGEEFPSYDSFGIGEEAQFNNDDFVAVGGLFDYDSADFSEFLNRPESLQA